MSKNDYLVRRLRLCPFCGGSAATVYVRDGRRAVCHSCHAAGSPEFNGRSDQPSADDRAIEAWNRRHPDAIERGAAQGVRVRPLDLSHLLQHAFMEGRLSARRSALDAWVSYDPTGCAAYDRILSALDLSTPPAPAPDAGEEWKLVPVEPTEEMLSAAEESDCAPYALQAWMSMIAAAPSPTAKTPAVEARLRERVAERCAAIADDLANDELFLDEKGRYGAELAAATIRVEFELADRSVEDHPPRSKTTQTPDGFLHEWIDADGVPRSHLNKTDLRAPSGTAAPSPTPKTPAVEAEAMADEIVEHVAQRIATAHKIFGSSYRSMAKAALTAFTPSASGTSTSEPDMVEDEAVAWRYEGHKGWCYRDDKPASPDGFWTGLEPLYSEVALKAKTDEIERLRRENLRMKREADVRAIDLKSAISRAQNAEQLWDFWNKKARSLAQKSDAAEASNKALREGLEPFAQAADECIDDDDVGTNHIWEHPAAMAISIDDLRRARALLSEQDGGADV